jgi:ArsR family transcriptional regulator
MLAMLDPAEVARVLDILGNRNRRRIIDLLRQKPCFVTEISERLTISPKAVIEHLQMLERENILAFRQDDRRRKYYFLANDITVIVNLEPQAAAAREEELPAPSAAEIEKKERLRSSVQMLRRMIDSRQNLISHLEDLDHDIDTKVIDLARNNRDIFPEERDVHLIIALCHGPMNEAELQEFTEIPGSELEVTTSRLEESGIIEERNGTYALRGIYAE